METRFTKRLTLKRLALTLMLTFSALASQAGFTDKIKNTVSKDFNSFQGIYIMGGIIVGGLLIYVVSNHMMKEKPEDKEATPTVHHSHHRHHRHHRVAKKST
jgi:hypothetical protein